MNVNVNVKCKTLQRLLIKKELWSKMDIPDLARTLLYLEFLLYAFSIAISDCYLKNISNSHSHSHFQQNLKTKVSIISPLLAPFPTSPRSNSCVATEYFLRRDAGNGSSTEGEFIPHITTAGTRRFKCRDNYCISPKNVVSLHRQ